MRQAKIPTQEYMTSGHLACQGCGATQAMRFALKALGQKTAAESVADDRFGVVHVRAVGIPPALSASS